MVWEIVWELCRELEVDARGREPRDVLGEHVWAMSSPSPPHVTLRYVNLRRPKAAVHQSTPRMSLRSCCRARGAATALQSERSRGWFRVSHAPRQSNRSASDLR